MLSTLWSPSMPREQAKRPSPPGSTSRMDRGGLGAPGGSSSKGTQRIQENLWTEQLTILIISGPPISG